MALQRIQKELSDINKKADDYKNITVQMVGDDAFHWQATINGDDESPYRDGVFFLDVKFPKDYPFRPPEVKFDTKIYHCNVNEADGKICMAILKDDWSPALTVIKVLTEIETLLRKPNPDDAVNSDAAALYKSNIEEYNKKAEDYTAKYAQ